MPKTPPRKKYLLFTENCRYATEIWRLAWPILVTGLAQVMLTIVDTALLGRYSTEALASVALAAPVYLVATMAVRGGATATQVLVARRLGAGDHTALGHTVGVGVALTLAVGVAVMTALLVAAPATIQLLGGSAELLGPSAIYLRIVALGVPPAAVTYTLQGAFAGLGKTRIAMHTAFLVNAINLPLSIVLIFGLDLGVVGAAVATLISTGAGACYLFWYGRHRLDPEFEALRRKNLQHWRQVIPGLWRIGWPESSMLIVGYANEVVLIRFVAGLGTAELAANRVIESATIVPFTAIVACGTAVATLAGFCLGSDDFDGADHYRRAGSRVAALLLSAPALLFLVRPEILLGLLTSDEAIVALGAVPARLSVLSIAPFVLLVANNGLLRAAGDNRFIMAASIVGDYLVLLPLAWLCAYPLGMGLSGIYLGWIGYSFAFSLACHWRYRQGRWRTTKV